MKFTPNAASCWNDFFKAALKFCHKYQGKGIDYELSSIGPDLDDNEETIDGMTISLSVIDGYRGWHEVDCYHDFMVLIQKLPTFYPDGDLTFTNQPDENGIILHLWHD